MRLVENWKQAWKMFSVQALALLAALPVVWMTLPEDVKAMVPADWMKWIMVAIAIGGLVGRLIAQPKVEKP
jgi:hypothetical protein